MDLQDYFANHQGLGVLATADTEGRVNTAVYARPHILDDGRLAFIMRDRLTRQNLLVNPRASYLFAEQGLPDKGLRLYLHKVDESTDQALVDRLSRRPAKVAHGADEPRYLVGFDVERVLELVGGAELSAR